MTLAELFLWHELRNWGNQRRERMLLEIQQRYTLYPVDRELCKQWALLKAEAHSLGRVLESADAWIAATAMQLGVPLVTHNAKDFRFLPNLKIIAVPSH